MTGIEALMRRIRRALTPDLLKPEYRAENRTNPLFGHCYVATEALYHILQQNGYTAGFKPARGRDERGIVHWWLERDDGAILDVTREQYTSVGLHPPYAEGRRAGFLTKEPSRRAQTVIDRVRGR